MEVFVLMILFLLLFGLYSYQFQGIVVDQTTNSPWSGAGTLPGLIIQGIGIIFIMLTLFWIFKQHSREGVTFQ